MKLKHPAPSNGLWRSSVSGSEFDDYEMDGLKDVYHPTGPALLFLEMEMAFGRVGYDIRKSELSPHTPPVVVLRLIRTAPQFPDQAQFVQHIREILDSVGIFVPKGELTAQQSGNAVLVAFPWQPTVPGGVEGMDLDELLAILP